MKAFLIAYLITGIATITSGQQKLTTFILLRHAEKVMDASKNPALTEDGIKRAENLVAILKSTSIKAIYSTAFIRTRETVAPLANAKGLPVLAYEAFDKKAIEKILIDHLGGTIVICGHSNNIPWIANQLTGSEKFSDFADNDYSNLLIVTVSEIGKSASVTWLNY